MKKLLFPFTFILIATNVTFSQKIRLQKVTFGVVVPVSANLTIITPLKPFALGYNLLPNAVFITNKTYHNFLYGTGNNVIRIINGWKPKKDLGVYLALQKNLSKSGGYAGIGVEKFIPAGDNVTFFLFSEVGKNIGPNLNTKVFIIGTHINIQLRIWKK